MVNKNKLKLLTINYENVFFYWKAHTWKVHRKLLNTAFTLKVLQSFIPIFNEGSKEFVNHLSKHVNTREEFNLLDYAVKATLDSICGELFLSYRNFKFIYVVVLKLLIVLHNPFTIFLFIYEWYHTCYKQKI